MAPFFGKVKQGIDKGYGMVSVKSKEIVEVTKLVSGIGALKEQKRKLFPELGQAMYSVFGVKSLDGDEKISQMCSEIAEFDNRINQKKEEIRRIRLNTQTAFGKVYCDSCEAELTKEMNYCSRCGKMVEREPRES